MNIEQMVWENTLNTCIYINGYENSNSIITVQCKKHNYTFKTKYENISRGNRKHHICPFCKQEDKKIKYADFQQQVECAYCGKIFTRSNSRINSKNNLYFCCRLHKDLAQRVESGEKFEAIRPEHYKFGNANYRLKALSSYPHKCAICGWDEDVDVLQVHHIDENRNNNDIHNLIILCPTCHWKITLQKYKLENNKIILK